MQAEFWHQRWEKGETGFHEGRANSMLVRNFAKLGLGAGARVFVPLCGKTRDIAWLLSVGQQVVGAELSEIAVEALFAELEITPEIRLLQMSDNAVLKHYSATDIDIFSGDIFALDKATLGPVDGVYDRAALVAMPEDMRAEYADHIRQISAGAIQLLICFEYDQQLMDGPPFSVNDQHLRDYFAEHYQLALVDKAPIEGGLKGKVSADEEVWLLTPQK